MRKSVILKILATVVVTVFVSNKVFAQGDYEPALKIGRKWIVEQHPRYAQTPVQHDAYEVVGDSTFNGRVCKVIRWTPLDYTMPSYDWPDFEKCWYEENGKVYGESFFSFAGIFPLQWDIFISDETLRSWGYGNGQYEEMTVMGQKRRVVVFPGKRTTDILQKEHSQAWVEGVGPVDGFIMEPIPFNSHSIRYDYHVVECYDGSEKIFDYDEFVADLIDYENRSTSIDRIDTAGDDTDGPIFNLQGIRVEKPRPGQIYIVGGRKVMW